MKKKSKPTSSSSFDLQWSLKHRPTSLDDVVVGNPEILEELKQAAKKTQALVIFGGTGTGKCIVGNSLVSTSDGLKYIEDLIKEEGYYTKELDVYNRKGKKETTSHFYKKKVALTYKIDTHDGYQLEGTPIHPVLSIDERGNPIWRKLEDLRIGDYVAVSRKVIFGAKHLVATNTNIDDLLTECNSKHSTNLQVIKIPQKVSPDLGELLGWFVSEGYFTGNNIDITLKDYKILKRICSILFKEFGIIKEPVLTEKGLYVVRISSKILDHFFSKIGYVEGKSGTRSIPWCILQSPKSVQSRFLQSLFEGDGGFNSEECISYYSKSKQLIQELQALLLTFGITSRQNWKIIEGGAYGTLNLTGPDLDLYMKKIGFISKRKNNTYIKKFRNPYDKVANLNRAILDVKSQSTPNGYYKYKNKMYRTVRLNTKGEHLTYARLSEIRDNTDILKWFSRIDPPLKKAIKYHHKNKYKWVEITSISKDFSEKYVYDFTLPKTHSFIANGIVNHNTTCARAVANLVNGSSQGILEEDSSEQGVAKIRKIYDRLRFMPPAKKWIVILDEVHGYSKEAFKEMLKLLEDPPSKNVLFILLTNHGYKIPPEILNRCRKFEIQKPEKEQAVDSLVSILKKEKFKGTDKQASKMAAKAIVSSDFCMREAIQKLESMYDRFQATGKISEIESSPKEEELTDADTVTISILKAMQHALTSGNPAKSVDYVFKALPSTDATTVLAKLSATVFYGYSASVGGNWHWAAKLYQASGINPSQLEITLIANGLSQIRNDIEDKSDPLVYIGSSLAALIVKLSQKNR